MMVAEACTGSRQGIGSCRALSRPVECSCDLNADATTANVAVRVVQELFEKQTTQTTQTSGGAMDCVKLSARSAVDHTFLAPGVRDQSVLSLGAVR